MLPSAVAKTDCCYSSSGRSGGTFEKTRTVSFEKKKEERNMRPRCGYSTLTSATTLAMARGLLEVANDCATFVFHKL